jgi:hypothetical protein
MYDSVTVSQLPVGGYAYAGYIDGGYANWDELVRTFPHANLLSITTSGNFSADAHAVDDEAGDANNPQAVNFIRAKIAAKVWRPVAYTQASNLAALTYELESIAPRSAFRLWSAHYTGTPHLCAASVCGYGTNTPADATQYAADPYNYTFGRNIDISLLNSSFFEAAPKPQPKPHGVFIAPGFYRWVADGTLSLDEVSVARNTTATVIYDHSMESLCPLAGTNRANLTHYARGGPNGAQTTSNKMPRGLVYYTVNT